METLPRPAFLAALGIPQVLWAAGKVRPEWGQAPWVLGAVPGTFWVIAWLVLFWSSALLHSSRRKERFDETSRNFFRGYLDFLVREGHDLFRSADSQDLYQRIDDWRRQGVQGIAIGLGPEGSEAFFQRTEGLYPLGEAYKRSLAAGNNEALCLALKGHLEELSSIRERMGRPGGLSGTRNERPGNERPADPARKSLPGGG